MNKNLKIIILLFYIGIILISCQKFNSNNHFYPSPEIDKEKNHDSPIYIGVFGGSLSSTTYSEAGKNMWRDSLGPKFIIETKGNGGAGFSSLTKRPVYIQIDESRPYDVYILWASLNDYYFHYSIYQKDNIGDLLSNDLTTQSGGINFCYELIRNKNPKAIILFFNTLPNFAENKTLIEPYVKAQIDICNRLNIPYLDQNSLSGLTENNFYLFFLPDKVHLNENGYKFIAPLQIKFLKYHLLK